MSTVLKQLEHVCPEETEYIELARFIVEHYNGKHPGAVIHGLYWGGITSLEDLRNADLEKLRSCRRFGEKRMAEIIRMQNILNGLSLRKRGLFSFIFYAETAVTFMEVIAL